MQIRELKKNIEDLDQEVVIKGRITNVRMYPYYELQPTEYRIELNNGTVLELSHNDIFGVLEKE